MEPRDRNEVFAEARAIAEGQSMMLPTRAHLQSALLELDTVREACEAAIKFSQTGVYDDVDYRDLLRAALARAQS